MKSLLIHFFKTVLSGQDQIGGRQLKDQFMDETGVVGTMTWSSFAWERFALVAVAAPYSCIPGKDKGTWASPISSQQ